MLRFLLFGVVLWLECVLANFLTPTHGDWMVDAIRNWAQYGLFHLNGEFVCNPGGLDEGEAYLYYPGHRPLSLYPLYFVSELFGVAGFSRLPFLIFLASCTSVAIWFFLGRGKAAVGLAMLIPLSASFLYYAMSCDPIGIPVLIGLPAMLLVACLWQKQTLGSQLAAIAIAVLYIQLNWPTIFPFVSCLAYLLASRPVDWRRLLILAAAGAVSLGLVTYLALHARFNGQMAAAGVHDKAGQFNALWQGYLWGETGYGGDSLSLGGALTRILICVVAGLLPYLATLSFLVWRTWRQKGWFVAGWSLLPLILAFVGVVGMRNLIGHHPWMAGPPFLVGIIFSIALARQFEPDGMVLLEKRAPVLLSIAVVYSVIMVALYRQNEVESACLIEMVQRSTPRAGRILVTPDVLKGFNGRLDAVEEIIDRKAFMTEPGKRLDLGKNKVFLLTTDAREQGGPPLAESLPPYAFTQQFVRPVLDWYHTRVAHRKAADGLNIADHYFLYQVR